MTYLFVKQNGYKFILCKPDGTIKAFGNSREVVAYSRQRKPEDRVLTTEEYRATYPEAR